MTDCSGCYFYDPGRGYGEHSMCMRGHGFRDDCKDRLDRKDKIGVRKQLLKEQIGWTLEKLNDIRKECKNIERYMDVMMKYM